ncbi:MAG: hypothetical protein HY443_00490 [Candidatus Nealsonbacteria bacterium]|nr:hypothetical protein [Candidatus Nealsonbacteria bacterium]
MWDVSIVGLPPGFRAMEDEDFVQLFRGEEEVATFSSSGVNPEKIKEAAEDYLRIKPG